MVSEFIDAYSDDQIYLDMLEKLVNKHPVEGTSPDSIKYSSFSRLWIVMMVGSIECMIKEWGQEYEMGRDIFEYFEDGSNLSRINRLQVAFLHRGIPFEPDKFEDYLAAKFIRNAYIHSDWNEKQKIFVESRGFPGSLMGFDEVHFGRLKESYFHVMMCLGMAKCFHGFIDAQRSK